MRKSIALFLYMLLSSYAFAYDFEVDGIYYDKISSVNKTVSVASLNKVSGDIVLPSFLSFGAVRYKVISIGSDAFRGCTGLTSITIPESVTNIWSGAFSGCTGLTSISIPNSVTGIGDNAFSGCTGLTSISIPNSVTEIGYYAFSGCKGLTSITIPESVTYIGGSVLWGCSNLNSIIIEDGNTTYDSRDNCNAIIVTSTNTLIAGCSKTIIPNTITRIAEKAFSGCSSLTSINIPEGVTSLGYEVFRGCSDLTSITIPETVTSIENGAFSGCNSLDMIILLNTEITGSNIVDYSKNIILLVPNDQVEKCKNLSKWSSFGLILPIDSAFYLDKEISFSDAEYATFYDSQYAHRLSPELIALSVCDAIDSKLQFDTIADGAKNEVIPKGVAVLLKNNNPDSLSYKVSITLHNIAYSGVNYLMGSDVKTITHGDYLSYFYKLSYGPTGSDLEKVLGWYWGASDGEEFSIEAHKAWLAIPKRLLTKSVSGFDMNGNITSVVDLIPYNKQRIAYDLSGRILDPNEKNQRIIIKDGNKTIFLSK